MKNIPKTNSKVREKGKDLKTEPEIFTQILKNKTLGLYIRANLLAKRVNELKDN